ncbi:hypothetical protein ODJ79_31270 [Actinoplanes sp. KI2]|uniref:hypothetical protein n=1 Tax=Actinoplanes sp. KI2 TaxID=2983315 RepID=UPI0021D5CFD0|nr:hypothetical protein [Actinoplanes sp. KI2]MCU7728219.1 hypothetical protein [Actinoplanes sp. KI2]
MASTSHPGWSSWPGAAIRGGHGHDIDLAVYWFPPGLAVDLLTGAGFEERVRLVRAAEEGEKQPRAYVLGVKPG